jgi:hypothetical protein
MTANSAAAPSFESRAEAAELSVNVPSFNGLAFMALKFSFRAEMFVNYAMFSSGARRDPRACRGIWKRCYPACAALAPASLRRTAVVAGEASLGKQVSELLGIEVPFS